MENLPVIQLDEGWYFRYFPIASDMIVDGHAGIIPSLSDWQGLEFPDWIVWLHRTFILEPTDFCIRYYLHVDAMPQIVAVVINEHDIGIISQDKASAVDVTDYVALEENTIAMRVARQGGGFGSIRLQAVACEED